MTENRIRLYHTGYQEIPQPDVRYGRRNADFGQGFYTTRDEEFAKRWAKEQKGMQVFMNTYELDLSGLSVLTLERDDRWFDYVFRNRAGKEDLHPGIDVITGPIANDTLFDTLGILTSGLLPPEKALKLMMIGPSYVQTVLKTEKAASHLVWLGSKVLAPDELASCREVFLREEAAYQTAFAQCMESL